jgi:hypothetical protein
VVEEGVMMLDHSLLQEILAGLVVAIHQVLLEVLMQELQVKEIPVVLEHLEEILVELLVAVVVPEVLVIMLPVQEILLEVPVVLVVNFLQHSKIQCQE